MGAQGILFHRKLLCFYSFACVATVKVDNAKMGDVGNEGIFEVSDLLDYKSVDGVDTYLVKWKGYAETTWEADENIGVELNDLKESLKLQHRGQELLRGGLKRRKDDNKQDDRKDDKKDNIKDDADVKDKKEKKHRAASVAKEKSDRKHKDKKETAKSNRREEDSDSDAKQKPDKKQAEKDRREKESKETAKTSRRKAKSLSRSRSPT